MVDYKLKRQIKLERMERAKRREAKVQALRSEGLHSEVKEMADMWMRRPDARRGKRHNIKGFV